MKALTPWAATALVALVTGCGGSGGSPTPAEPASGTVLRSFSLAIDASKIRSGQGCAADIEATRMCIGFINVPPPQFVLGPFPSGSPETALFQDRTGLGPSAVHASKGPLPTEAAVDSFVQRANDRTFGIYLNTRSRGPALLSNIDPLFQFERFPPAGGAPELRLTPWKGPEAGTVEIAFSFDLRAKRLVLTPGSLGWGQAVFNIFDTRAERHFYFVVTAFGTQPPVDRVLIDEATGQVIVETGFRASPYGRNFGAQSFSTPSPFVSPAVEGTGGHYEFRFNVEEFRLILATARTLEPRLSADPADYLFDDFAFNTEIAGDGEIGETLGNIEVRLLRR